MTTFLRQTRRRPARGRPCSLLWRRVRQRVPSHSGQGRHGQPHAVNEPDEGGRGNATRSPIWITREALVPKGGPPIGR